MKVYLNFWQVTVYDKYKNKSENNKYVANRGEAQCIMVRTYTELFYSD